MHNPLLGPVPNYGWAGQPSYGLDQAPRWSEYRADPHRSPVGRGLRQEIDQGGNSRGKSAKKGGTQTRAVTSGQKGRCSTDLQNHSQRPNNEYKSSGNGYDLDNTGESIDHGSRRGHSPAPEQPGTSRGRRAGHSSIYSHDPELESLHNESLTITDQGEFVLGPQWKVPEPEVAQDMAGYHAERAMVKSIQYSTEHESHFTLKERIEDCHVLMSGGISTGEAAAAESPDTGGCSSLLSCWGRPQSPDYTDIELQPPLHRPSGGETSLSGGSPNIKDGHRSISGVLASAAQSGSHELISKSPDYSGRDRKSHDDQSRSGSSTPAATVVEVGTRARSTTPRRNTSRERTSGISRSGRDDTVATATAMTILPFRERHIRNTGQGSRNHDGRAYDCTRDRYSPSQELTPRTLRRTKGFHRGSTSLNPDGEREEDE